MMSLFRLEARCFSPELTYHLDTFDQFSKKSQNLAVFQFLWAFFKQKPCPSGSNKQLEHSETGFQRAAQLCATS